MRVVAGFHTRNDEWILGKKLEVLRQFCDGVVVVMDRPSPLTVSILMRSGIKNLTAIEHVNTLGLPDNDPVMGPLCEEGAMRQEAFEAMALMRPDYMVLGDTDEIPTPDIVPLLERAQRDHPKVDVFQLDIVNLYRSEAQYVSGRECVWSLEHPQANKRSTILRYDPRKTYNYDVKKSCHVRLEPEMVDTTSDSHVSCRTLRVSAPKVLHYKFANWDRWLGTYKAGMKKYQDYWQGLQTRPTPREWLW